jgi:type IV pilus assembly protein PilW
MTRFLARLKGTGQPGMQHQKGFTLVELMITILVSSVVVGAAYTVFSSQQKTYTGQKAVVDIQENLRAGMFFLTREVRMAGYCQDDTAPDAGFQTAGPGSVRFTMDIFDTVDDDGDGALDGRWQFEVGFNDGATDVTGEDIMYALSDDADQDGLPDTLTSDGGRQPCDLIRTDVNTGTQEVLMQNVEAIGFAYACDYDKDGMPDLTSNGNIDWLVDMDGDSNGRMETSLDWNDDGIIDVNDSWSLGTANTTDAVTLDDICMVRIWMLVRSPLFESGFYNQDTYVVGANQVAVADNYRRRLLSASMVCRNLGD